jgi:hypothetical protein
MGTRLYPRTRNVNVLEKLAGVPAGTSNTLEELETKRDTMDSMDYYDLLDKHPEANILDNFMTFGWGKLNSEQWAVAKELLGPDECWNGSITDPADVLRMLNAKFCMLNGVSIEELEGVYWG